MQFAGGGVAPYMLPAAGAEFSAQRTMPEIMRTCERGEMPGLLVHDRPWRIDGGPGALDARSGGAAMADFYLKREADTPREIGCETCCSIHLCRSCCGRRRFFSSPPRADATSPPSLQRATC